MQSDRLEAWERGRSKPKCMDEIETKEYERKLNT